jgi:hypothetical protein
MKRLYTFPLMAATLVLGGIAGDPRATAAAERLNG